MDTQDNRIDELTAWPHWHREDARWNRARLGLLAVATGLTFGGLALVPTWPEDAPEPATAIETTRRTFDRRPPRPLPADWPSDWDPAIWHKLEAEAIEVNAVEPDDAPEPPLSLDPIEGTVSSAVLPPEGGGR